MQDFDNILILKSKAGLRMGRFLFVVMMLAAGGVLLWSTLPWRPDAFRDSLQSGLAVWCLTWFLILVWMLFGRNRQYRLEAGPDGLKESDGRTIRKWCWEGCSDFYREKQFMDFELPLRDDDVVMFWYEGVKIRLKAYSLPADELADRLERMRCLYSNSQK